MLAKRKLKSLLQVTIIPVELKFFKKDGTTRTVNSFKKTFFRFKMDPISLPDWLILVPVAINQ